MENSTFILPKFELDDAFELFGKCDFKFKALQDQKAEISFDVDSFSLVITLSDCKISPEYPSCTYNVKKEFSSLETHEKESRLYFSSDVYNFNGELLRNDNVTVVFKNAQFELKVYDAFKSLPFYSTQPWKQLGAACAVIKNRGELSFALLNQKEKELFELVDFIFWISVSDTPDEARKSPEIFRNLAKECKAGKIELLLKEKSSISKDVKKKLFFDALKNPDTEQLFRKIKKLIVDTQEGYSVPADETLLNKFEQTKKYVSRTLYRLGYNGEYPHFFKTTGVKCATFVSYDSFYTVINEKSSISCVDFFENFTKDGAEIIANSSIGFFKNKDAEDVDDVTCGFDAKGKSRVSQTVCSISSLQGETYVEPDTVKELCVIAAKKAELKKLSNSEVGNMPSSTSEVSRYIFVGVLSGFLFAALFVPAMVLFTVITEGDISFLEEIKSSFWKHAFLVIAALFGALMTLALFITKRVARRR